MEQPCPAGIVTPWITKIGYFCRYGKKMECSSRTFAFTVDGEYSYITENGGVTSKYCAGLCAKGKNKLATEIQVHTVWKGTITRRNSAKACVQRENTVQTAVGIGMRHHRRNAWKRDTNMSVRRICILPRRIKTSSSCKRMNVIGNIDYTRNVLNTWG